MGLIEAQNISAVEAIGHAVLSGEGDIVERKRDQKKLKKTKNKEGEVDEADIKEGADGELTVAYGSGDTVVNVEKKSKKTKKNKSMTGRFEMSNTKEVDGNKSEKNLDGESISEIKSTEDANKERKKHKSKRKREDGDFDKEGEKDGKEGGKDSQNCEVHATEILEKKKRKKEKKKSKDDIWCQDTFSEGKHDEGDKERKKHKSKRKREDGDFDKEGEKDGKEGGQDSQTCEVHATEILEKKKRKKEKKKSKDDIRWQDTFSEGKHDEGDLPSVQQGNIPDNIEGNIESTKNDGNATNELARKKKKKKKKKNKKEEHYKDDNSALMHTDKMQSNEVEYANKKKKKYTQLEENGSDDMRDNGAKFEKKGKLKETKSVENGSNDATPNKSNKKVRFSGQDEFFPIPGDSNKGFEEEENLVRGKRFTREEDEIVKEAVLDYIQRRDLGDEGLDMVLNCKKHPEVRGCWKEIGSAIPYRPYSAVYYRAHILFRRSENRKWTQEEYDEILEYQEEHGNEWKALAEELGRHRFHVKDTWRRIKLSDRKTGHWSQDEYQKLFDLVNADLKLKLSEEKRSKHGMLRDNICWTAISDELSTRPQATCCVKWYKQLTSSMVSEGIWADADDYRLIDALYSLDATCVEDVDWDCLIDDRTGDVCRKRWNQMVLHIGRHGNNSFAEQVEVLAQRYCPNLLEARETWDSKPRVP